MMVDIQIRKQTNNRLGLQDALRAIVAAGGSLDKEWPVVRILAIGDQATGTHVLEEVYARWNETAEPVNLATLWGQLGVQKNQTTITFNSKAPLALIRIAIAEPAKSNVIR
jgi:predicted metalloprotease with PDZ domain